MEIFLLKRQRYLAAGCVIFLFYSCLNFVALLLLLAFFRLIYSPLLNIFTCNSHACSREKRNECLINWSIAFLSKFSTIIFLHKITYLYANDFSVFSSLAGHQRADNTLATSPVNVAIILNHKRLETGY